MRLVRKQNNCTYFKSDESEASAQPLKEFEEFQSTLRLIQNMILRAFQNILL